MKIAIANDHRGVKVKRKIIKYLEKKNYEVIDLGSIDENAADDYPDFAFKVGHVLRDSVADYGILICRTGVGMSIAANKVNGVRCAKVDNVVDAKLCRIDNNANCMAINSGFPLFRIKDMIDVFLKTDFSTHPRHRRRVDMIDNYRY